MRRELQHAAWDKRAARGGPFCLWVQAGMVLAAYTASPHIQARGVPCAGTHRGNERLVMTPVTQVTGEEIDLCIEGCAESLLLCVSAGSSGGG